MVILDVDGVMTDGRMVFGSNGFEMKFFDVYDGYGITRAIGLGLQIAIISRGTSEVTAHRAKQLGITEFHQRALDKVEAFNEIRRKYSFSPDEVCFIGDDEYDLGLLRIVGLSAAPPTAYPAVLKEVDFVTTAAGGRGCVREVLDMILRARKLL